MTQQRNSKGELRAAFAMSELDTAKRRLYTGTDGVFIRVTLAIIFMYLIAVAYLMLGTTGPVFVSVLFLVALCTPFIYHVSKNWLDKRLARNRRRNIRQESPQES